MGGDHARPRGVQIVAIAGIVTPMATVWTRCLTTFMMAMDWISTGIGTWIANVSGGSRCLNTGHVPQTTSTLTGDTSRHGDQRYVHVSPWDSAWPVEDPSGGTR